MKEKSRNTKKNVGRLDRRKSIITTSIICIVMLCVFYAIFTIVNSKTSNIEIAKKQTDEPKAISDVTARQKNANNYTPVTSLDGIEVPVPKGYTASSVEEECYVNGVNGTYKLQENLTLASPEGEIYPWTKNETTGVWSSGNYHVANSESTIESNEFTVSEAATVRINWSVSCEDEKNGDYVYYTITGTTTGGTGVAKGGTGTEASRILGEKYGTEEANLIYENKDVLLEAGTYKVTLTYEKNGDTDTELDKAYVKSIGVYTKSAEGSEITVREKNGGFVIYEGEEAVTESNVAEAKTTRNQFVWVPVEDVKDLYHITNGVMYGNRWSFTASGYTKVTNVSSEPKAINDDDDRTNLKQYLDGITREEFSEEMKEEFYNMLESVATYGGFYIGRYETGDIGSKAPVVRKGNSAIDNVNWYGGYKACKNLKGTNKAVQTGLIWGTQWFETLKWIAETKEKTYFEIGYDSTSWGNYTNSITSGAGGQRPTGYSEFWKANNIYDLAGNLWEMTMEVYTSVGRLGRGGKANTYGASCNSTRGSSTNVSISQHRWWLQGNTVCLIKIYLRSVTSFIGKVR